MLADGNDKGQGETGGAEVQGEVVLVREQAPQPPVMGEGGGVGGEAVRGPLGRADQGLPGLHM